MARNINSSYKYKLTPKIPGPHKQATAVTVSADELMSYVKEELENDYGEPFGPGFVLTIEVVDA